MIAAGFSGFLAPASQAQDASACATVKEFGLETVEGAKAIVQSCRSESGTRRRGLSMEKSLGEAGSDMTPAERVEQAYAGIPRRPRAIYVQDDRMEAEDAEALNFEHGPALTRAIKATAILTQKRDMSPAAEGSDLKLEDYKVSAPPFGRLPLCPSERFSDQKTGGFCTAFLVAPDVVATAGHCVEWDDVDERNPSRTTMAVVFGFETRNGKIRDRVTKDETFDVVHIRELSKPDRSGKTPDFALLQLDREVPASLAVPLRLPRQAGMTLKEGVTRLALIGHPSGLPKKVSLNPNSKAMQLGDGPIFRAQLNSFHGNSGSPVVFYDAPDVLAGILVNGQEDFAPDIASGQRCVRYQLYQANQLCNGERCSEGVTNASQIEPYVP
jgi:V8-like Glu-specific endopeptidase